MWQPSTNVDGGLDRRGEPVAKLPYSLGFCEKHDVDHYGGKGNI